MTHIKVIVFDFDNCIAFDENTREGSEEIKDRVWFEIFPEYEHTILNSIIEQTKKEISGGKGDRKDIVKAVLGHFQFPENKISDEIIRRCDNFNTLVQKNIGQINISPEVKEILTKLSSRFPLYINTATPREAILESLQTLKLKKFFKNIYTRPGTKRDNLKNIINTESIQPSELIFIGDSQSDWKVAQEFGCKFIGIQTAKNKSWHNNFQPFPIIKSLTELTKIISIV